MHMQDELRYPSLVRARVPRELSDTINVTAHARFMTSPNIFGKLCSNPSCMTVHSSIGMRVAAQGG